MYRGLVAGGVALAGGLVLLRRILRSQGLPVTMPDPLDEPPPAPVTPANADRSVTIVDNGGRPFIVHISYTRCVASVYANTQGAVGDGDAAAKKAPEELRSFRFKRAFVGLDPKEPEAEVAASGRLPKTAAGAPAPSAVVNRLCAAAAAGGNGGGGGSGGVWWHGGNSVLLDLGRERYVYVGSTIFAFTAVDHIHTYVSTMGNSAVPYPYALGTANTYFFMDRLYAPSAVIERARLENDIDDVDPYKVLYCRDVKVPEQSKLQDYQLLVARR